jgi:hypothetical protein
MITLPILMFLLKTLGFDENSVSLHPYQDAFTLSYYGNTHFQPGVQFGYEYAIMNFDKEYEKAFIRKKINRQVIAGHHLGWFYGTNDLNNIYINTLFGYRYTFAKGIKLETLIGGGYLLSLPLIAPYENDQGELVKSSIIQQSKIYPSITLGIGKDFSKTTDLPLVVNFRPAFTFPYPNSGDNRISNIMLEAGVGYYIKTKSKKEKRKFSFRRNKSQNTDIDIEN